MRVWSKKESRVECDRARRPWKIVETAITTIGMEVGAMVVQARSMPSASH